METGRFKQAMSSQLNVSTATPARLKLLLFVQQPTTAPFRVRTRLQFQLVLSKMKQVFGLISPVLLVPSALLVQLLL